MHELSIAIAILDRAKAHLPPGALLERVHVVVGRLRAVDPDALQFAWRAALADAGLASSIELDDVYCDGDELKLTSIEVEDVVKGATPCGSQS